MNINEAEHASGLRPIGDYPDHCPTCRGVAEMRDRQASCDHNPVTIDFGTLAGHSWRRTYCDRCQYVYPVGAGPFE